MFKRTPLFIIALALFGFGCQSAPSSFHPMSQRVSFQTSDGVTIVGDYYVNSTAARTVLLIHMRPATRESWKPFAKKLLDNGFAVLAIDLRGHGESTKTTAEKTLAYQNFTEAEESASIHDLEAAAVWLAQNHSVTPDKLELVGASIGANLVLQYAGAHHEIPAVVALSPGLVYRGVDAQPSVKSLKANQKVFFVAAKDDNYAALSVGALAQETTAPHEVKIYDTGGHAMKLFEAHTELVEEIVQWLEK